MAKTLKKIDISKAIHNKIGYTKSLSEELVDSILSAMKIQLKKGHSVKIHGFGSFIVKNKKARKGRNPQTGQDIIIAARAVLKFQISKVLRNIFKEK